MQSVVTLPTEDAEHMQSVVTLPTEDAEHMQSVVPEDTEQVYNYELTLLPCQCAQFCTLWLREVKT